MKLAGEALLRAPVEQVWDALLDPSVLVRTIPGCERLEETGDNRYAMTITAGVAAIRGTYDGTCELSRLRPYESLLLQASGAGAPGTVSAEVAVALEASDDGSTRLTYDADAVVGGMVGGVGQRMLTSIGKRMAGEFFGSVEDVVTGTAPAVDAAPSGPTNQESQGAESGGRVHTPAMPGLYRDSPAIRAEFVRGLLTGAGLVLAGVVAQGWAGRRRQ